MSTYPRLQGKRGKKLKEKRKKQQIKKLKMNCGPDIDTSQFMGLEYEDAVFIPEHNGTNHEMENGSENNLVYSNRRLQQYQRVGTDGVTHFYEEEEEQDEGEESEEEEKSFYIDKTPNPYLLYSEEEKEEEEKEDTSDDSDNSPLPTFLLNKGNFEVEPIYVDPELTGSSEQHWTPKMEKKMVHSSKKAFAKGKEKGIVRSFTFLQNNELISSLSFAPIPIESEYIRSTINKFCEKFNYYMETRKEDRWLYVTVSKPSKMPGKNKTIKIKSPKAPSQLTKKTLMEGLSTPISEDNKGSQLLKKFGWEGGGLGQQNDGIVEPIGILIKRDNKGIGADKYSNPDTRQSSMSFVRSSDS